MFTLLGPFKVSKDFVEVLCTTRGHADLKPYNSFKNLICQTEQELYNLIIALIIITISLINNNYSLGVIIVIITDRARSGAHTRGTQNARSQHLEKGRPGEDTQEQAGAGNIKTQRRNCWSQR